MAAEGFLPLSGVERYVSNRPDLTGAAFTRGESTSCPFPGPASWRGSIRSDNCAQLRSSEPCAAESGGPAPRFRRQGHAKLEDCVELCRSERRSERASIATSRPAAGIELVTAFARRHDRSRGISFPRCKRRPEHRAVERVGDTSLGRVNVKCAEKNRVQRGRDDCQTDLEDGRDGDSDCNGDPAAHQEPQAGGDAGENRRMKMKNPIPWLPTKASPQARRRMDIERCIASKGPGFLDHDHRDDKKRRDAPGEPQ